MPVASQAFAIGIREHGLREVRKSGEFLLFGGVERVSCVVCG